MSDVLRTDIEELLLTRRSARAYKNKEVPKHILRRILETGRFAPSAGNCQPWKFIVIQNRDIIDDMEKRLIKILSKLDTLLHTDGWKRDIVVSLTSIVGSQNIADLRPLGAAKEVLDGRLKIFHDAPALIIVLKDTRGIDSPSFDTGICSQNMVMAAHAIGLGTCYIGFTSLLMRDREWMNQFKISGPWEISTAITIGYPRYDSDGICQRDMPQIDMYDKSGHCEILY